MSAEIILLNKLGVAIAADSAITVGNRAAIFNNAQKIFPFGENIPLAFVYYSHTEFMGIPIDIIFQRYFEFYQARKTQFSTLEETVQDFTQFVEKQGVYFTFKDRESILNYRFFQSCYQEYLYAKERIESEQEEPLSFINLLRESFSRLKQNLEKRTEYNQSLTYLLPKDYLNKTIKPNIKKFLQEDVFGRNEEDEYLTDEEAEFLDYFSGFVLECYHHASSFDLVGKTSIYLIGYGKDSLFPGYKGINLFGYLNGKLLYNDDDKDEISQNKPGLYKTLAQDDAIDAFFNNGYTFDTLYQIQLDINAYIKREMDIQKEKNPGDHPFIDQLHQALLEGLEKTIYQSENRFKSSEEIKTSISKMALLDLADYAENLINLQSIRRKYEIDSESQATVGGPINVAVIYKYKGFQWYKK